ncbi:MAG: S16 family serine protease [Actinomycetaceae bacterium]|nr:S16 family serine protease [Actinomycetaceae bacterium]
MTSINGMAVIFEPKNPSQKKRRRTTGIILIVISVVGLFIMGFAVPMPYVIETPGPTFDVIGSQDDVKVINVKGAKTYPTKGELRMVTVSLRGGPGMHVSAFEVLGALFDSSTDIIPVENVFPKDLTQKEREQQAQQAMVSSQSNAELAALSYLGIDTPAKMVVAAVPQGSPSENKIKEGDVITHLSDGKDRSIDIKNAPDIFSFMAGTPVNTELEVTYTRDGKTQNTTVTTVKNPRLRGGSLMGIYLDPHVTMPYDISIALKDVGGPSAGMMFALGIIDELTPGALNGGKVVAGTGAISIDGQVQPISGVPQKMAAAKRDGAQYFLVPADNCKDTIGAVPKGLRVVKTDTLKDAVDSVEKIGKGSLDSLPSCPTHDRAE